MREPRRFAILGTRGIPANYGGFETFAEELSTRLVERGDEVTVYCRTRGGGAEYRGVKRRWAPAVRHKYLETLSHTFLSTIDLLLHRVDAALYCNAANAVFTLAPRMAGMPVALNVDGLERERKKWNVLGKAWYRVSERMAAWFPNVVVSDARVIQDYYRVTYHKDSVFIPYGATAQRTPGRAALDALGLEPGRYFLYVSRMEPENNALLVRESFEQVAGEAKLALIGDAPYAKNYIERVRATSDKRVVMPGAIYGQGYAELQSHCLAYVHATEVGGTHPALIEAMGRGALVLYLRTPENEEVAGGAGLGFERGELAGRMRQVLEMNEAERAAWGERAAARVREHYSWDAVTDEYEALLCGLAERKTR